MEHKESLKIKFLAEFRRHAALDGWSETAWNGASAALALPAGAAELTFADGLDELLDFACAQGDAEMTAALQGVDLPSMKIRVRIRTAVQARIQADAPHKESVRAAAVYAARPDKMPLALGLMWRTVDAMWWQAGDTATDWNHYSKRGLLLAVYASSMIYWLNETDIDDAALGDFIARRIDEVLAMPQFFAKASAGLGAAVPMRAPDWQGLGETASTWFKNISSVVRRATGTSNDLRMR